MSTELGPRGTTTRKLRIGIVTQGYQTAGGIQTVTRWLVAGLRDAGHTVHIFNLATSRKDPHSRRLVKPSSWRRPSLLVADASEPDVTHVGANGTELEFLRYLPRRELDQALADFGLVQVVCGGPALGWAVSRLPTVALQAATTVRWERAAMLDHQSPVAQLARRTMMAAVSHVEVRALRHAGVVFVENREMCAYARRQAPDSTVVLAPPGVDATRFTPHPQGWRHDGYLLSVCRLADARKGLDRLVDAYAVLRSQRDDAPHLVLAGRNTAPAALTAQIANLGLSSYVEIRSDVAADALPQLFQGASVYLQTSHEEGLGISVVEAMASGIPVVATRTAGTQETVSHGTTGLLVAQGPDVAVHVAQMTARVLDGEGPAMAVKARERAVTAFSSTVTLQRFLAGYDRLLDRRPREHRGAQVLTDARPDNRLKGSE